MCYTWNKWCAMHVCLIMLNNACAKINAELGVALWQQSRARSRSKHMYYLFALSLSNGLSAELRAHFYDTIAQKRLFCLYFFFASLLLVIVCIVFTLPHLFTPSYCPLVGQHSCAMLESQLINVDNAFKWYINQHFANFMQTFLHLHRIDAVMSPTPLSSRCWEALQILLKPSIWCNKRLKGNYIWWFQTFCKVMQYLV